VRHRPHDAANCRVNPTYSDPSDSDSLALHAAFYEVRAGLTADERALVHQHFCERAQSPASIAVMRHIGERINVILGRQRRDRGGPATARTPLGLDLPLIDKESATKEAGPLVKVCNRTTDTDAVHEIEEHDRRRFLDQCARCHRDIWVDPFSTVDREREIYICTRCLIKHLKTMKKKGHGPPPD